MTAEYVIPLPDSANASRTSRELIAKSGHANLHANQRMVAGAIQTPGNACVEVIGAASNVNDQCAPTNAVGRSKVYATRETANANVSGCSQGTTVCRRDVTQGARRMALVVQQGNVSARTAFMVRHVRKRSAPKTALTLDKVGVICRRESASATHLGVGKTAA
jgi:hypothetical protein